LKLSTSRIRQIPGVEYPHSAERVLPWVAGGVSEF
jgi:hypothetical protein